MPFSGFKFDNQLFMAISGVIEDPRRFSKAEKEALKAAAIEFAKEKGLSQDNFDWLFHSRTGEQRELTSGAWKAIASNALPHRSARSVWACGTRILHPSHYKVSLFSPSIPAISQDFCSEDKRLSRWQDSAWQMALPIILTPGESRPSFSGAEKVHRALPHFRKTCI